MVWNRLCCGRIERYSLPEGMYIWLCLCLKIYCSVYCKHGHLMGMLMIHHQTQEYLIFRQTHIYIYNYISRYIIYNVIHVTIKYINRLTLYSPVYNYIYYIYNIYRDRILWLTSPACIAPHIESERPLGPPAAERAAGSRGPLRQNLPEMVVESTSISGPS